MEERPANPGVAPDGYATGERHHVMRLTLRALPEMRADIVLDDCRRALDLAEDARTEQDFRVHWVALVALLRAVGHVLDKVDAAASPALRRAVDELWDQWRRNRAEHRIFWDFIEAERNSVLKTYELGFQPGDIQVMVQDARRTEAFTLEDCIFKPLLEGPFAGEDGRDIARDAISWWERQLSEITSAST